MDDVVGISILDVVVDVRVLRACSLVDDDVWSGGAELKILVLAEGKGTETPLNKSLRIWSFSLSGTEGSVMIWKK